MRSGSCVQVAALGARLHVVEDELRSARAQLRERAVADRADLSKIEVAQAERDEWQRQIDEVRRGYTATCSCGLHAIDGSCLGLRRRVRTRVRSARWSNSSRAGWRRAARRRRRGSRRGGRCIWRGCA